MTKQDIQNIMADLRYLTLFPRKYRTPRGRAADYWRGVSRSYGNAQKVIETSDYHWRVIEYRDGHRELTYLRVLKGGLLSGLYPAIYRGLIIPRRIGIATFSQVRDITPAF